MGLHHTRGIPVSFVFGVSPLQSRDLFAAHTPVKQLHFAALTNRQIDLCSRQLVGRSEDDRAIMTSCERFRQFPSAKWFRLTRRHQRFREKASSKRSVPH
jgi:hypothetical protein